MSSNVFHFGCYSNEGGWVNDDELLKGVAAALPTLPPAWVAVAASVATGVEGKGRLGAVAPLLA